MNIKLMEEKEKVLTETAKLFLDSYEEKSKKISELYSKLWAMEAELEIEAWRRQNERN